MMRDAFIKVRKNAGLKSRNEILNLHLIFRLGLKTDCYKSVILQQPL